MALYWHIELITMRFSSSRALSDKGVNRDAVIGRGYSTGVGVLFGLISTNALERTLKIYAA
jgi:hypothetical protein